MGYEKVRLSRLSVMKMANSGVVVQLLKINFVHSSGAGNPSERKEERRASLLPPERGVQLRMSSRLLKVSCRKEAHLPCSLNGGSEHEGGLKGSLSSGFCSRRMLTFFKYSFEP